MIPRRKLLRLLETFSAHLTIHFITKLILSPVDTPKGIYEVYICMCVHMDTLY